MSNEELALAIKNGYSVTDNLQRLYEQNLGLLKTYIKSYTAYENEQDLLQEGFLGLWEACKHYDNEGGASYSTYCKYWVQLRVRRYIENSGCCIRYPEHINQQIFHHKQTVNQLSQTLGRTPTRQEVAAAMGLSVEKVAKIEQYGYSVTSLDTPLNDDADMTLGDTVQAPTSLENETVDNLFNEEIKTALWAICETETSKLECAILKETVAKQKTLKQAADTLDISYDDARKLKNRALRRLYKNRKIKRYYNEIDKLDSGAYRGGVNRFKANDFTSVTEYIAIRRTELEKALQKAL